MMADSFTFMFWRACRIMDSSVSIWNKGCRSRIKNGELDKSRKAKSKLKNGFQASLAYRRVKWCDVVGNRISNTGPILLAFSFRAVIEVACISAFVCHKICVGQVPCGNSSRVDQTTRFMSKKDTTVLRGCKVIRRAEKKAGWLEKAIKLTKWEIADSRVEK